jgi:hypothetical protein
MDAPTRLHSSGSTRSPEPLREKLNGLECPEGEAHIDHHRTPRCRAGLGGGGLLVSHTRRGSWECLRLWTGASHRKLRRGSPLGDRLRSHGLVVLDDARGPPNRPSNPITGATFLNTESTLAPMRLGRGPVVTRAEGPQPQAQCHVPTIFGPRGPEAHPATPAVPPKSHRAATKPNLTRGRTQPRAPSH